MTKFESYISSKQLMAASVKTQTAKQYRSSGEKFYKYVEHIRIEFPSLPLIKDILTNFDIFQLDTLIYEFLTKKFNRLAVTGGTLKNNACGILYCLACDYGISLNCELLPGVRKVCKGADNVLSDIFGERQIGKYPLLNPMIEEMIKDEDLRTQFAVVFPQRMCLRSQHYCNPRKKNNDLFGKKKFVQAQDFHFIPNFKNPRAIVISTNRDKNNPQLEHMERAVYCTCGVTKWTCLVHLAKRYFEKYPLEPTAAVVQCRSGDMYYGAMLSIIKKLVKKIGLDPKNYGTHSLRSGGTTELFMIGKNAIWIQNFGWWNNIGSVLIYIRPNNPDLPIIYGKSVIEYHELRQKEGGVLEKHEKELAELQTQVALQNNKKKRGKKTSHTLAQAAVMSGTGFAQISTLNHNYTGIRPPIQHIYTDYTKESYRPQSDGSWKHNPKAKARMVITDSSEIRIVTNRVAEVQVVPPVTFDPPNWDSVYFRKSEI